MPSDHLVFCPPAYFVIEEPSPARQRMDSAGIIGFEYRDGPDEPPQLMLVTKKNVKASLHSRSASVRSFPLSPCLMFVYLYLVLSRVPAAVTSIPSGVQTNLQHPRRLMFVYFSPPTMPTSIDVDIWRESRIEHCSGRQRVRDERVLAVGWAVWRRSYLNRNPKAASSGLYYF
jgi:hypothetical protein